MPDKPHPGRSANDDAADALARMMSGESPHTPPPTDADAARTGHVAPASHQASGRDLAPPSGQGRVLPASPKPRAADEPAARGDRPPPAAFRPLPRVAGSSATPGMGLRPSSADARRAWREALVPPLLVLGVLLSATGILSLVIGERLVLGSLPAWMGLTAVLAGGLLLTSALLTARSLKRA